VKAEEAFIRYNSPGQPWSNLTAYDLNSGTIRWQAAIHAGARLSLRGLIFAATASDHKIRAYDEDTGAVLWEKELPVGQAPEQLIC
jgi:quinoprotein glucose dehydrogenase